MLHGFVYTIFLVAFKILRVPSLGFVLGAGLNVPTCPVDAIAVLVAA